MADAKISEFPARVNVAGTDEVPTIAGGVNYRSPLSSIMTGGLYDVQRSGVIGDGSTDDRTALAAADTAAIGLSSELFINRICKVNSNLTLTSRVQFGPGGRLKPASGVTIFLDGGFIATPTRHVFDISLSGECWPRRECDVTARNYGAIGDGIANDRIPLQHLIDCRLYFQRAGAVHIEAANFFVSGGPLIVNYGNSFRSIDVIGAAYSYDSGGGMPGTGAPTVPAASFPGTFIRTDYLGNLFEIHGARGMTIANMGLDGPLKAHIISCGFNAITYTGLLPAGGDPYDHNNWLPPAAKAAGSLTRYKMNSGIHIDPRGSELNTLNLKPVALFKTDVRLVVTTPLAASTFANGLVINQGGTNYTLATGERVLQAAPIDEDGWPGLPSNGVYTVPASPVATLNLARATDFDAATEFVNTVLPAASNPRQHSAVNCTTGSHTGEKWVCNSYNITLETTPIEFCRFDGELAYEDYVYPAWAGITGQYGKMLSSNVTIKHCIFRGFGAAVALKGCDADNNADFVRLEYCGGQYNVYQFAWGHTQARDQGTVGCQFANCRTHISTQVVGRAGGKAHFKAVNSEFGGGIDILDIPNMSIAGGVSLDNCYCESGNRIGRCYSTSASSSGFEIAGGHYGLNTDWHGRIPKWLIDVRNTGVQMTYAASTYHPRMPFIVQGDPTICTLRPKITSAAWMNGGAIPPVGANPVGVGDAIAMHSTMGGIMFTATGGMTRQGPYVGDAYNEIYSINAPNTTRVARMFGKHTPSSVSQPIPFCAATTVPAEPSGSYDATNQPIPVALGRWALQRVLTTHTDAFVYSITGNPALWEVCFPIFTITLKVGTSATNLANAANWGLTPGSIIHDIITGNLFVIQTLTLGPPNVIVAKALNNFWFLPGTPDNPTTGGAPDPSPPDAQHMTPIMPSGGTNTLYFYPTGHYTPNAAYELTYTAGSTSVTVQRTDGANIDATQAAQFPVGAVKMVNDLTDSMTPIRRANTTITAVTDMTVPAATMTLTMSGAARVAPAGNKTEPAGIWFVPRP